MKKLIFLFLVISAVSFAQTYNDTYKIEAPIVAVTQDLTVGDDLSITGELVLGSLTIGTNVFTTTAASDTVLIDGADATDIYFICGNLTSAIDQQDVLQWQAISGALVVHRMASGESALKYSWIRINK